MQKLEEILHVEDSARHSVAEAREQTERIAREAAAEADLVHSSTKRVAAAEARARREAVLAEARAEAERIRSEADVQHDALLAVAEGRIQVAVDAVVRELMG